MVSTQAVTENQFTEQFREYLKKARGGVSTNLREEAFAYFAENGFPTPRLEDWKYTNVAPVGAQDWKVTPVAFTSPSRDEDVSSLVGKFRFDRNGFTALNAAFAEPFVYRIPKETRLEKPFEIDLAANTGAAVFPHIVIIAEAGCKATIVESYESSGRSFTNSAIQVVVEDNANLTHYRVQKESAEAFHYGVTEVSLGLGSYYNSTNI